MPSTTTPESTGRWWPDGVRAVLIAALTAIGMVGVAEVVHLAGDDARSAAAAAQAPATSAYAEAYCEGVTHIHGVHGTDCRSLPVVTAPGALGPANTGSPACGTDWESAYPGSNVWIPDYQISGRLFVLFPGSRVKPPPGYELLGKTPAGASLYWRPVDYPSSEPPTPEK